ncbi:XkdX family protein [Bacillus subtilis]|nr:XkdX family protein [Bacillus subtilis]WGD68582.1 XkdX family protein [Bacillus subtilis]WGD74449.1 XkdX family protein [Bacillus subtilis]WGD89652.1 XkdX family protein [Bacillus subtilis]
MKDRSTFYGFFEDCWKNGTVLTIELKTYVQIGRLTQAEFDAITALERGNAYPDQTE